MRFDWYQATVHAQVPVPEVLDMLKERGGELRECKAIAGYRQGFDVFVEDIGPMARVLVGGQRGTSHLIGSGDETSWLVDLLREKLPDDHLVTRADAAEDFNQAGAYDMARAELRKVADKHRLSFLQYADDLHHGAGRTQYVGSPSSQVRLRAYEKGKQVIAKAQGRLKGWKFEYVENGATGERVRADDWTRVEAQVRPGDEVSRRWMAKATPEEAWGCSAWLREIHEALWHVKLERFVMRRRKETSTAKALEVMCGQYGAAISKTVESLGGDWDSLGEHIRSVLANIEERKRRGLV